jgi:uncharacterized protein YjbI with pentapeptide repeats
MGNFIANNAQSVANPIQLEILNKGAEKWNLWRKENAEIPVDLEEAVLADKDLREVDLTKANLSRDKIEFVPVF